MDDLHICPSCFVSTWDIIMLFDNLLWSFHMSKLGIYLFTGLANMGYLLVVYRFQLKIFLTLTRPPRLASTSSRSVLTPINQTIIFITSQPFRCSIIADTILFRLFLIQTLVPVPRSFFMDVKCPGCFNITTVFSHAQTVVICGSCATVLCQPTGGKARLTEGCSFRKK